MPAWPSRILAREYVGRTGGLRRRARLVVLVGLMVGLVAQFASNAESRVPRMTYAIDGRARDVVVRGQLATRGLHGRARVILQQRRSTAGGVVWRDRVSRVIRLRPRTTRFSVRWPHPPVGRLLYVRVIVRAGHRVVARGGVKTVRAGDPGTVFYSGIGNAGADRAPGAKLRLVAAVRFLHNNYDGAWTAGLCDPSKAAAFPSVISGEAITELAGYSLGRLGPIYFLKQPPSWASQISYILLLDPGGLSDFAGSCDTEPSIAPWQLFNAWLVGRSTNRLVIMSGTDTSSLEHAAIRAYYLRNMSAATTARQVLVCDKTIAHDDFMKNEKGGFGWMVGGHPPQSCPSGTRRWNPPKAAETSSGSSTATSPPTTGGSGTTPTPVVHLTQGPAAPAGYWYAVSLAGFAANTDVTTSCYDSVSPIEFRTFAVRTNGSGSASTQSGCYSGDGPDHWVVAGGITSNHVAWSVANPPPARVAPYNNYGGATVGHAMCRGNPAQPASLPGGTASQSFSIPSGVHSLDFAMVQIDPDSTVTAHATMIVNGSARATSNAAAAGDTNFSFVPVTVTEGDQVTLQITFTATSGKIITVYTAGNPGGVFSATNSCPDGAPTVTSASTGLRAVVSGWSG